ncbi:glycosyltransferase [Methylomonas rosea]|uniref:Glycosyltransferase n=1 Tax=Methylomonas rosea TaxID=2952227 RepID=A0ABT1TY54_9GAMM|nr:glycosyltransferase [Methylomonas sp. WSC-7]MCQ8119704.1 glycosyltransferase [Methylomonas sp. WSC-7]
MKILHIIRSVNPEGGGPIEAVIQLSLTMQSFGHVVEILSLDEEDGRLNLKECPLTVHAKGPGIGTYGYSKKFIPWLSAHAKDYDAFIVNGIWQYHSFAAHSVLKKLNSPYYLFTHGMLDPWFKHQYPLKHLKKCLYWFWGEYPVIRDAAGVLFTCEEEKVLARQSFWPYRCNENVVNFGTAGHVGDAAEQKREFLDSFPDLRNKPFLLYLSRIHPKKGVDLLLEAFAQRAGLRPDLQLVVAGPDQVGWQSELQDLAAKLGITDRVTWTGMLKGDLKWGAYHAAEAFILPSHQENFGIVVAEALSCRLPVLISNKVNIWQEIANADAGLVADDTLTGCGELLDRWRQQDNERRIHMGCNALNCFKDYFEITSAAKSLLAIISK